MSRMDRSSPGGRNSFPGCVLQCSETEPYLEVPENQGPDTTRLARCVRCKLVMERPRPSREQIRQFYENPALWFQSRDAEGKPRSYVAELEAKKPIFGDLVRRIEQRKRGGTVLDVGCGAGLLELCMERERWSVRGVENSRYIAEFGARELGAHVECASFEEIDLPPAHFDVIVMKYVLDHMEQPFAALEKARRLIKEDGLLVIADLINIESFCARFFAEGHRLIHPMHLTYFSRATIASHLSRAGFAVQRIEYPYFRTPYFSVRGVATLGARILRRGWNRLFRIRGKVFSTAWYGNMMDVWAVPV